MMMQKWFSFRHITNLFIIFQAVIILFFTVSYHLDSQQSYAYSSDQVYLHVNSSEFDADAGVRSELVINRNVYVDSHGVYRSREDLDSKVDRKMFHDSDQEDRKKLDKGWNSVGQKKLQVKTIPDIEESKDPVEESKDPDEESKDPDEELQESVENLEQARESAIVQHSGMGNLTKEISNKVKNAKHRFVADKRILFSEVYEQVDKVEDLQLLLIVSSSAKKRDRRDAIRASWWEECPQDKKVRCYFFTDDINSKGLSSIKNELLREQRTYKDMVFQPIDTGVKFGYRLLYQLQWALAHYKFQYILRVDDDIMLCLHRLRHDLRYIRKTSLQWGVLHCMQDNTNFIDEGIMMLTRDVVMQFLSQNPLRMRCHVFGDQQIATWIQDLNLNPTNIYMYDLRIHHSPPASEMRNYFDELDDICINHIAVHGVYPTEMEDFWAKKRTRVYPAFHPLPVTETCDRQYAYHWRLFKPSYRYQPKYCHKKPQWTNLILESADGQFIGREQQPQKEELWEKMHFAN